MAWTTPRTWVSGEIVTAALMNTHVRDNLTYLKNVLSGHATDTQAVFLHGANGSGGSYNAAALGFNNADTDTGFWKNTLAGNTKGLSYSIDGVEAFGIDDSRNLFVYGTFEGRPGTPTGYPTPTLPDKRFEVSATNNVKVIGNNGLPLIIDRLTSDGTLVSLRQDGTEEGYISVTGTTVTYQTFLGAHPTQLADGQAEPPRYGVVVATGELCPSENTYWLEERQARHPNGTVAWSELVRHDRRAGRGSRHWREVQGPTRDDVPRVGPAARAGDPRVYGVWWGKLRDDAAGMSFGLNDRPVYTVAALGLGKIRVCDSGGDIAAGDLLEAAPHAWEAQRQADDLLRAGTIARALVAVRWAAVPVDPALGYRWTVIPCTLHAG
jgi:hypothetical protein